MKKETTEVKESKIITQFPGVYYNPSLDQYEGKILFPKKLAAANESLKKSGFPGITPRKK